MRLILIFALFASPVAAQVARLEVAESNFAGDSLSVKLFQPDRSYEVGLGYADNHAWFGAATESKWGAWDTTVGTKQLGLAFDGGSVALGFTGLTLERNKTDENITLFSGASGRSFAMYTNTAEISAFATGALYQRRVHRTTLSSLGVIETSGKYTAAVGASYHGSRLSGNAAAGLISNSKFIEGGGYYTLSKTTRITANHNEFFSPFHVSGSSAGVFSVIGRFSFSGNLNQSASTRSNFGQSATVGLRLGPISESSGVYHTKGSIALYHSLSETLNRHLIFTQSVLQRPDGSSFSAGGELRTNRLSLSIGRQVQWTLSGKGYIAATTIQLSFRIHDSEVRVNSAVSPYGKIIYQASTTTYKDGVHFGNTWDDPPVKPIKGGKFVIEGTVAQADGSKVEGAVIKVGNDTVVSDSQGHFLLHTSKGKPVAISLDCAAYLGDGEIEIVDAPTTAIPNEPARIVVRRKISTASGGGNGNR